MCLNMYKVQKCKKIVRGLGCVNRTPVPGHESRTLARIFSCISDLYFKFVCMNLCLMMPNDSQDVESRNLGPTFLTIPVQYT